MQILEYYKELFIKNAKSDWLEGKIADIGKVVGGGTPSTKISEYYSENDGIPWITPKDLANNQDKFIYNGRINITDLGFKNSSTKLLPKNSVLFSSRAPIGYIAIAANEVTTNQGFKSIIPNENIGTAYIYCYLKHNLEHIESMATGSTFKEVSANIMKNIPIVIPDSATIEKFNSYVNVLFETQKLIERENARLQMLKKYFLAKLFETD